METRVTRRLVAAAAESVLYLPPSPRVEEHTRPDTVAIGSHAFQTQDQPVAAASGLVAQVNERLVLRLNNHVDPAVVVEVARGQASAEVQDLKRVARTGRDVRQAPVRPAGQQLDRHFPRENRRIIADMPIGGDQVEPAVVIGIEEGDTKPQQVACGRGQAHGGRAIREQVTAQVAEKRGRLAVIIGDGQVGA